MRAVLVPQQGTSESGCRFPLGENSDSAHLHMIHSWQTRCFRLLKEQHFRRNVNVYYTEVYYHTHHHHISCIIVYIQGEYLAD